MNGDTAYDEAVGYLLGRIRGSGSATDTIPAPTPAGELHAMRHRRMTRMRLLLDCCGSPERAFVSFHVGGTSGKGSTAATIHQILRTAGSHCGLHTTPYLQVPIEKLVLDDAYIEPARFAVLVRSMRRAVERAEAIGPYGPPSYGEIWVALTFLCFADAGLPTAVVEVGHGGRWDYTNVLPSSVAAITSVGFDHVRSLGPTLEAIAAHKAGIIKPGRPVVVGPLDPGPMAIVEEESRTQSAPVWRYGSDFAMIAEGDGSYRYDGPRWQIAGLRPALLGDHQAVNAGIAIAAIEAWGGIDAATAARAVPLALPQVRFPGRLEVMRRDPTVVLDGAHNPQKAAALRAALLRDLPHDRLCLLFGALAAKQAEAMLALLAPLAARVIVTAPTVYHKASADPEELAAVARSWCHDVVVEPAPRRAMERALDWAGKRDLICATGSLYVVGEIREAWISSEAILAAAVAGQPPPWPAQELLASSPTSTEPRGATASMRRKP